MLSGSLLAPLALAGAAAAQVVQPAGVKKLRISKVHNAPYPIDKDGYVHAPQAPGLGAPWSREFFDKHGLYWEA
jgi:L-alanine-DL-glutamate epimerase-like enolase superfamily enzyme